MQRNPGNYKELSDALYVQQVAQNVHFLLHYGGLAKLSAMQNILRGSHFTAR